MIFRVYKKNVCCNNGLFQILTADTQLGAHWPITLVIPISTSSYSMLKKMKNITDPDQVIGVSTL